ncbi:MAG TPA: hypothetical protein VLG50_07085 [Candidatus Saccharimonadales bacterium]|nr:hypothetical protein [Candidatus Saccharimonadales bacterium]
MRLELIQGIQIIIIAFLSYVPTVTISGWFEAWAAKKCGDDLPEQFGFLTLDPMAHFNIVGFGFLLIGKLFADYLPMFKDIPGWGRYIPLSPSEHNSKAKVFFQFTARAIAHFVLLLTAFFTIVFLFKGSSLATFSSVLQPGSSFLDSLLAVLIFFYRQNFILCVIYFVIGIFRSILFFYFPSFHLFSTENVLWAVFILIVSVLIGSIIVEFILDGIITGLSYLFVAR